MSITRITINPAIQWYQPTDSGWIIIDYNNIVGGIIQWKNILYEQVGFGPGKKFGVGSSQFEYTYITAMFAGLELGGKIIVMPTTESGKKLIGPLDTWIYEEISEKAVRDGETVGAMHTIPWSKFYNFTSKFKTFDHLDQFSPDNSNTVLTTTTSGTTGTPKVIEYSHRLFDDVRDRSIKIFNFKQEDRILHLSNIHHGGTSGVFFLPSLFACRHHYFTTGLTDDQIVNVVKIIKEEKISKAMFPNNLIVSKFLKKLGWLAHDFEIYVNQANSKSWVDLLKQTNVKAIHSLFGSTETLGPIFLNTITKDSLPDHNVLNYGKLLDDHYTIKCHTDHTVVKIKNHYQEVLNDCFVLDQNGDHIFQSRSNLIRINDHVVSLADITKLTQDFLGDNGVIIPDSVANKIYVAYTSELTNLDQQLSNLDHQLQLMSPVLHIDHADCVDLDQFIVGIKLSMENLRTYFRQKYKLL